MTLLRRDGTFVLRWSKTTDRELKYSLFFMYKIMKKELEKDKVYRIYLNPAETNVDIFKDIDKWRYFYIRRVDERCEVINSTTIRSFKCRNKEIHRARLYKSGSKWIFINKLSDHEKRNQNFITLNEARTKTFLHHIRTTKEVEATDISKSNPIRKNMILGVLNGEKLNDLLRINYPAIYNKNEFCSESTNKKSLNHKKIKIPPMKSIKKYSKNVKPNKHKYKNKHRNKHKKNKSKFYMFAILIAMLFSNTASTLSKNVDLNDDLLVSQTSIQNQSNFNDLRNYIEYDFITQETNGKGLYATALQLDKIRAKSSYAFDPNKPLDRKDTLQIYLDKWYDVTTSGIHGYSGTGTNTYNADFRLFNHAISNEPNISTSYPLSTSNSTGYNSTYSNLLTRPGYSGTDGKTTVQKLYSNITYEIHKGNGVEGKESSQGIIRTHNTVNWKWTNPNGSFLNVGNSTASHSHNAGGNAAILIVIKCNGTEKHQWYKSGDKTTSSYFSHIACGLYSRPAKYTSVGSNSYMQVEYKIDANKWNVPSNAYATKSIYKYSITSHGIIKSFNYKFTTYDNIGDIDFTSYNDSFEIGTKHFKDNNEWFNQILSDHHFKYFIPINESDKYITVNSAYSSGDILEDRQYIFEVEFFDGTLKKHTSNITITLTDVTSVEIDSIDTTASYVNVHDKNYQYQWQYDIRFKNQRNYNTLEQIKIYVSYDNQVSWEEIDLILNSNDYLYSLELKDSFRYSHGINKVIIRVEDAIGNVTTSSITNPWVSKLANDIYMHEYFYEPQASVINVDYLEHDIRTEESYTSNNSTNEQSYKHLTRGNVSVRLSNKELWDPTKPPVINGTTSLNEIFILSNEGVNEVVVTTRAGVITTFKVVIDKTAPSISSNTPGDDPVISSTRETYKVISNKNGGTVTWTGSNSIYSNDIKVVKYFFGFNNQSTATEYKPTSIYLITDGWHGILLEDKIGNISITYFVIEGTSPKYLINFAGASQTSDSEYLGAQNVIVSWSANEFKEVRVDNVLINQFNAIATDGTYLVKGITYSNIIKEFTLVIDISAPNVRLTNINQNYWSNKNVELTYSNTNSISLKFNGEAIDVNTGMVFEEEGIYELHATNASSKSITIKFVIRKSAIITSKQLNDNLASNAEVVNIDNFEDYASSQILKDNVVNLDLEINSPFTEEATYTLHGEDLAGNKANINFIVDRTLPNISAEGFFEAGRDYGESFVFTVVEKHIHSIAIFDASDNMYSEYDDLTINFNTVGSYKLVVEDLAGNITELSFRVVENNDREFQLVRGYNDGSKVIYIFTSLIAILLALFIYLRKKRSVKI